MRLVKLASLIRKIRRVSDILAEGDVLKAIKKFRKLQIGYQHVPEILERAAVKHWQRLYEQAWKEGLLQARHTPKAHVGFMSRVTRLTSESWAGMPKEQARRLARAAFGHDIGRPTQATQGIRHGEAAEQIIREVTARRLAEFEKALTGRTTHSQQFANLAGEIAGKHDIKGVFPETGMPIEVGLARASDELADQLMRATAGNRVKAEKLLKQIIEVNIQRAEKAREIAGPFAEQFARTMKRYASKLREPWVRAAGGKPSTKELQKALGRLVMEEPTTLAEIIRGIA